MALNKPKSGDAAPQPATKQPSAPPANPQQPTAKPAHSAVNKPPAPGPAPVIRSGVRPSEINAPLAPIAVETIEMKVSKLPGLAKVEAPLFHEFMKKIAPKIKLFSTSRYILEAFSNIDVTSEKVAQVLRGNQYLEYHFVSHIATLGKRDHIPTLESAIVLLGMQNTRDLIVALQLNRLIEGGHPEWVKEGKLKLVPKEILKYAIKTEEYLSSDKTAYADTAYAAGLIFDIFALLIEHEASPDAKKKLEAYIEYSYNHGLKAAKVATELSKTVPDIGFKKYIFSAALLHDIGKIAMGILDPKYLEFLEQCSDRDVPRIIRHLAEQIRFGVVHNVIGALICRNFGVLGPIEKAILYHHEPYMLTPFKKAAARFASLISLSSNVSNYFKRPEKDDPVFKLWNGPELRDFRIDMKTVAAAVTRAT